MWLMTNAICGIDFTPHEASLQDAMNCRACNPGTVCRAVMNRPVGTEIMYKGQGLALGWYGSDRWPEEIESVLNANP